MVKVVICNGFPGSGKSAFQLACAKICEPCNKVPGFREGAILTTDSYSSVDFVKKIAYMCGWNGQKTLKDRKFLSNLKRLLVEWGDVPFKKIVNVVNHRNSSFAMVDWILFVDSREPEEIERLKRELKATTILIRRPSIENAETSNTSDANVLDYDYDLTIWNDLDGIEYLETLAESFIDYMKKEEVPHYESRND